jgi:hypothetical protein
MSRDPWTNGPPQVGSRGILRLFAAGREERTIVASPARTPEASFIASGRDAEAERLDAAAGCEFVDDRIRLRE